MLGVFNNRGFYVKSSWFVQNARDLSISAFSGSVHGAKSDYVSAFLANVDIMLSNPSSKLDVFYIFFVHVVIALGTFHTFMYHSPSPL